MASQSTNPSVSTVIAPTHQNQTWPSTMENLKDDLVIKFFRALIIDSLANLDVTTCSQMLPLPSWSCCVRSWEAKEELGSSYLLPKRNGYVILLFFLLLFDNGEHDVNRILVFVTESGLVDAVK